jgi:hypothetical protein
MQELSDAIKNAVGDTYELLDANLNKIKSGKFESVSLATWSSAEKAVYILCTMRDTSTDAYTFRYIDVFCEFGADRYKIGRYDFGSNISKGSDQTLKIDVDIRVKGLESP